MELVVGSLARTLKRAQNKVLIVAPSGEISRKISKGLPF